ncbi:MAG: DNA polymerase, partial [Patescibacteria group bacterium]
MAKRKKLMIIDGNALIHRAFHALPPLATKEGELVNAVYGFTTILFRAMKDLRPSHVVVTFDVAGGTFRHEQYAEYKAHRTKQPDELYAQIPMVKDLVHTMGIPTVELKGFEADDVIGTISKQLDEEADIQSIIVTGDMDTLQLVDDNTRVYTMRKGISDTIMYDAKAVMERYGLEPNQMIDYKALRGDPSDNIPGVRGIGEKGALTLLKQYGTLDGIYTNLKEVKPDGLRSKLEDGKKDAYMSKELVTIITDAPIQFDVTDAELKGGDREAIVEQLQRFGFKSLLTQIDQIPGITRTIASGTVVSETATETRPTDKKLKTTQFNFSTTAAAEPRVRNEGKSIGKQEYTLVNTLPAAKKLAERLHKAERFVFDTETDSLDARHTKLLGVSICLEPGEAFYVVTEVIAPLKEVLADGNILKIAHNAKFDFHSLKANGVEVAGPFWDTMVGSYVLNPGTRQHKLDNLIFLYFGYEMQPITDLIGAGKDQITMAQVPVEKVSWYSCEDADFTLRLYEKLSKELTDRSQEPLLKKIEMPLIPVLARMESLGVKLDVPFLKGMEKELSKDISKLQKSIYKHAGREFNISSPLQLKVVLFEDLQIQASSKIFGADV